MTKGDYVVLGGAITLALLLWVGFYAIPTEGRDLVAVVMVEGRKVAVLPLSGHSIMRQEVQLRGGIMQIEYGQGKVRVLPVTADVCPNGICWKTGWISRAGQSIVCVPNSMVITVSGASSDIDLIIR